MLSGRSFTRRKSVLGVIAETHLCFGVAVSCPASGRVLITAWTAQDLSVRSALVSPTGDMSNPIRPTGDVSDPFWPAAASSSSSSSSSSESVPHLINPDSKLLSPNGDTVNHLFVGCVQKHSWFQGTTGG